MLIPSTPWNDQWSLLFLVNQSKSKTFIDLKITRKPVQTVRACLHKGGGPQVGEVTCGGLPHLSCKRDHIKTRDCMDRRVTPPNRVTSPTWDPPPPCKQALSLPNNSGWAYLNDISPHSIHAWDKDKRLRRHSQKLIKSTKNGVTGP